MSSKKREYKKITTKKSIVSVPPFILNFRTEPPSSLLEENQDSKNKNREKQIEFKVHCRKEKPFQPVAVNGESEHMKYNGSSTPSSSSTSYSIGIYDKKAQSISFLSIPHGIITMNSEVKNPIREKSQEHGERDRSNEFEHLLSNFGTKISQKSVASLVDSKRIKQHKEDQRDSNPKRRRK
eukprot:TRINITY_DN1775_c0_g1_i2.p1 TRINITY_DN1775_c0_g1~~TRINITY_DN1775_c0_g1_i2.p1  ORF type:complete len:181 (-),score=57.08 TRINITY_DN1775_c0_g1_i2:97-639(-)